MRIAIAQINSHLGNFSANSAKIIEYVHKAKERRCDLVVFPEAALFGYHPMDLLERPSVVQSQVKYLKKISTAIPKDIGVLVGAFTLNAAKTGKPYFNSAVFLTKGHAPQFFHKELLPTYDVFDDARHIQPGDMQRNVLKFKGRKILVTICEDIWAWPTKGEKRNSFYERNPLLGIPRGAVDLCVNLSASPYFSGKLEKRRFVVRETAKYLHAPVVYVNMVGAQDELIFDGGSFCISEKGKILSQSVQWDEDLNVIDLEAQAGGIRSLDTDRVESLRRALVLGLRDFVQKTGQKQVHLGLSGGIDSAVVLCLAVDALGPNCVTAIALPGPYNAPKSLKLAREAARRLGVRFISLPITSPYKTLMQNFQSVLGTLPLGVVNENIQARIRGLYLMAFANKENSLLLNTTNKSEMAAGYGTMYGDLCGGLSPIGDLLKEDVYLLARHYNQDQQWIPAEIIRRPPTAELRPNQKDSDSLPIYSELDRSVERLVEQRGSPKTKSDHFLLKALMKSEFKRWQAPPILKVREHSFGRGRRMPLSHTAIV